jgi:predicted anti-sigma-YlaC factor YlaD
MNTDPADTRSPHLDLEDLIAEVTGQAIDDRAREHLTRCEHCRAEVNRWDLVASGVRGLAADPGPEAAAPEVARPGRPRSTGQRVLAGPWRRVMLVAGSVAAALVLLAGIGAVTGYVHISGGGGTEAALTSVTGCTQLQQADGTLEQVNGTSLVIKTAGGQPVTVTTTASTFMSMSGPLLSDITDGASVDVRGASSDGTIAAAIVTVGQPFSAVNPPRFVPVQGTVSDASTAGFTLVTSSGTRIPVTTSSDTLVVVPHASPGQLRVGTAIFAIGHAGPDGTLSARGVAAITQFRSGATLHVSMSVRDCSPSSIVDAIGAIGAVPGSGG